MTFITIYDLRVGIYKKLCYSYWFPWMYYQLEGEAALFSSIFKLEISLLDQGVSI